MDLKIYRRMKCVCDLGIDEHSLIPILLPEIRKIVPAYSSSFLWLDEAYKFVNIFDESPDFQLVVKSYVNDYLDNRDREARHSLSEWFRRGVVTNTVSTAELARRKFYHSDFYHEVLKPLGYYHSLYLRLKAGLVPVGILVLHRKLGEKIFSQWEKNCLQELGPVISHGLKQGEYCNKTLPVECDIGLVILDECGHLCHMNPQGRKLLFLATHPDIKKGVMFRVGDQVEIPDELVALVRDLLSLHHKKKIPIYRSLSWVKNNTWGCFVFRINWLQRPNNGSRGRIAVIVQYQKPALYCVLRRCEELGLTIRQTEVTAELLQGVSYEAVAGKLHLSTHTVTDHVKNVYEKLGIKNKGELLLSLLTTDASSK